MSVELGSSIGAGIAVSSGPATATFATVASLDAGPIGGWGKGLAAPEPFSFGSKSAASTSFVEGPAVFNPTGTIINSQPELNAGDAILEAESILAQVVRPQIGRVVEPDLSIAGLVSIFGQPEAFGLLQPEVAKPEVADVLPVTKLDAAVQRNVFEEAKIASLVDYGLVVSEEPTIQANSALVTKVETKPEVGSKISTQVAIEAASGEQISKEEVVEILDQAQSIVEESAEEEVENAHILHIVDKKGVTRRIAHAVGVILGVLQVKKDSNGKLKSVKITGSEVISSLLPSNSREIRGEEVNQKDPDEKLPDATWDETVKSLAEHEYTFGDQIEQVVKKAVEKNHPVAVSTRGEIASGDNIATTHKYVKGENRAFIEFKKRTQKKLKRTIAISGQQPVRAITEEVKKEETEGVIYDHPKLSEALGVA